METRLFYAGVALLFCVISTCYGREKRALNSFITHFEPLHYNVKEIHSRARRAAASPLPTESVDLKFNAFGHDFRIRLRRDINIFTPDYRVETGNGEKIKFDSGKFFEGEVIGRYPSFAHGSIVNGRFEGNIKVMGDEYHVEPSHRYFDNEPDFHSVIYKSSDVEYEVNFPDAEKRIPPSMKSEKRHFDHKHKNSKESARERYRRGVRNRNKNTCALKLVADQTFTRRFINKEGALIQMINHYKAVEYVFRNQTFNLTAIDRSYNPESIGFRVQHIVIYDDYDVPEQLKPEYISVEDLLDRFSSFNHQPACEAFLFTDRTFDKGVVGLAWIGYGYAQAGGICEPFASFAGKQRSYNTGLLTFKLYGKDSPPAVTEITFAHELGHAFGAKHDPKECQPGSPKGNFIMYDKATTGYLSNNKVFSDCSVNDMIPVINWKGVDPVNGCFIDITEALCGNGVIEWGEECDCGDVTTCTDICCTPAGIDKVNSGVGIDLGTQPCRLRNIAYQCSPSQGPCCNNMTCRYQQPGQRCADPTDCLPESHCFGDRANCPARLPRQNKTLCDDGSGVCIAGYCTGSRCLAAGLEPCACTGTDQQCHVCCMHEDQCKPWHEFNTNSKILNQTAGSPCLEMEGYCDSLGYCQQIDRDGPLRSLYKTFFTFRGFSDWVKRYWWVFLIGIPIALGLMFAFVYYCQVITPSSNPERELRAPRRTVRGGNRAHANPRRGDESIPMM